MKEDLNSAIEGLYKAFADVPKPHFVDGCPCCIERKEIGNLLSGRLRQISSDEISSYAFSAFLTVGSEADFQYFLPRIFELSTTDPNWLPDPEIALGKLRYVSWSEWREDRRKAIEVFLSTVFDHFVVEGKTGQDTWLCAVARTEMDIDGFLEKLKQSEGALIAIYEDNSECLIKGKLSNGFWNDIPESRNRMIEWFDSAAIRESIRRIYENAPGS